MKQDEKPRVVQVFKYYYPHIGGIEKVVQGIAEGLRGRVETTILTCADAGASGRDAVNGIEVVRAATLATYFSVPVAPRFPLLLKELAREADILHFHLPFPLGDTSYLLTKPHGKVVAWWHSEIVRPKHLSRLYTPFLIQFLRKADRIIVAAPQLVDASPILARFREKCTVIPIGIKPERFAADEGTRGRAAQIRKNRPGKFVLFAGRLIYYKGLEYLIEAISMIRDEDVTLLVIGEGPLRAATQALAERKGIAHRVVYLGRLSDREMVDCYHGCDVFVLPSVEKTEAFGIVQLEAMACGKPVVSTALPTGVPFVNQHGKTGLVVPPRDSAALAKAISALLSDKEKAAAYGAYGMRRVREDFTVDRMLEAVFSVYAGLIEHRPDKRETPLP